MTEAFNKLTLLTYILCMCLCVNAWDYKHCPDDFDSDIAQACYTYTSDIPSLKAELLKATDYDLRVMTFNTFDWNAGQSNHERIREWLSAVLPTVDVVGFQEFGYSRLNDFVKGFGFTPLHNGEERSITMYVRDSAFSVKNNDQVRYTADIGMDACNCGVPGYHRWVNYGRVELSSRTIHIANNHGCVGGCGGSSTAYGGTAILEVLNEKGFFENNGANSIFLGDVNYWNAGGVIYSNDPKGLCRPHVRGMPVGEMSVRGKLQCGPGHDLDFIGYGRNFRAVKHYSFSGAGNYNGDSDHKAVMIDLKFVDGGESPTPPVPVSPSGITTAVWVGKDTCKTEPCQDGQSDCDDNSECAGDLICWQRTFGETDVRYDTSGLNSDADVCVRPAEPVTPVEPVDPVEPTDSSPASPAITVAKWVGKDDCKSSPCQDGESDCDDNSECAGDLICWQRTDGETDPRYDTSSLNPDADVCIRAPADEPSSPVTPVTPDVDTPTSGDCVDERIVVATYNIRYTSCPGYYSGCQCSNTGPANYAAGTIRPDILGTQENGCQVDFGVEMGGPYEVVPYECEQCNHNAIYYNSDNVQYAGQHGYESITSDSYSIRMFSWSRMKTKNGFYFWVFNTHLPHTWGSHENIAVQMINKWKSLSSGEPAIFTGDFNPHKDSDRWEEYAVKNGLTKVGSGTGGVCGFCDQVYYSNGDFDVIDTDAWGTGGSDHTAYSVILRPVCAASTPEVVPEPPVPGSSTDSTPEVVPEPSIPDGTSDIQVEFLGDDACSPSSPCEDGKSDCDSNADCQGSLICWQRSSGETRKGYDVSAIGDDRDVCVQPATASTPSDETIVASMTDEFSGSTVDESIWEIQHFNARWKNNEMQCYVPSNVKVESGSLILEATRRTYWDSKCGGQQYFSGSVETREYLLYGTVEVRAKIPSGQGLWPAIWLLGDTKKISWPACGEIDLMEVAGTDPNGSKATLHYGPVGGGSINLHFGNTPEVPLKEDFHVWRLERTPDSLIMFFDGVEFGRKTREEILATGYPHADAMFKEPMRVILNVAVGGDFTGIGNQPPNTATWDKPTMEIDYVRVWSEEDIPPVPGTPCLETIVCGSDTCASCSDRIDWVVKNLGKTYDDARRQIEGEFPSQCVCPDAPRRRLEESGSGFIRPGVIFLAVFLVVILVKNTFFGARIEKTSNVFGESTEEVDSTDIFKIDITLTNGDN